MALLALAFLAVGCSAAETPETTSAPPEETAAAEPAAEAGGSSSGKDMPRALADYYSQIESETGGEPAAQGESKPKRNRRFSVDYPEPEDGEWLVDDEGREYFVSEVPKREGQYRKVGDDKVRMKGGITFELAGETEENLLVKLYRVEARPPEPEKVIPQEELDRIAASYRFDTGVADTLDFAEFDRGLPRQGQWRQGADVHDMNGDGHPDIVHSATRKAPRPPIIFLGDGAGTWKYWAEAQFPEAPYDYGSAVAADFDGDGHGDIALGAHLSGLTALTGDGAGHFEMYADGLELVAPGQGDERLFISRALTTADWNGDGLPDLLALSEGPRHPKAVQRVAVDTPLGLAIYLNDGAGSWTLGPRLPGGGTFGDAIATGDFDGDGRVDVVTSSNAQGSDEIIYLNTGDGARVISPGELRPRAFVWAVATGDFDGDGMDDAALSLSALEKDGWHETVDLYMPRKGEDGELRFERTTVVSGQSTAKDRLTAMGSGDVNADGRADLVGATGDGRVHVYLGRGDGHFEREAAPTLDEAHENCRGYGVRVADLDGQPGDEILASFAGELCDTGGSLRVWKAKRK